MQHGDRRSVFGRFELRPATGELLRDGRPLKLAPQPFQVLALIVERGGNLVTRDELRAAVWSDGTTVEFDQGLNYCIRQIRIVLEDDARKPTYIETVTKRGYRLLIPVGNPDAMPGTETPPAAPVRLGWRYLALAGLAVGAVITVWLTTRGAALSPERAQAERLVREANHLAEMWERDKLVAAANRYTEATQLEPASADAWAGLTHLDIALAYLGADPTRSLADSEMHARRALALDSSLAAGHAALGHSYWLQWRWQDADDEFRTAVAGTGDTSVANQLYGLYLASVSRKDDAVQRGRRAVEMAPLSGLLNFSLAQVYLHTGAFEAAIAQARRALEVDRHFPLAFRVVVRANAALGRFTEASAALSEEGQFAPASDQKVWEAYLLARAGRGPEARVLLNAVPPGSRMSMSLGSVAVYTALGDVDQAFARLEAGIAAHVPSLSWVRTAPELDPLRRDPRFAALVARMRPE